MNGNDDAGDDLDDLFGSAPQADVPTRVVKQKIESPQVRTWTDNTGKYQTVGRLVKVGETHVRLLKDNGRFTTVSKKRLSQDDLAYVNEMVKVLGIETIDLVARR